jgi:sulfate adenylyltransferase subunit 1 (EFTu-like GTPase family)
MTEKYINRKIIIRYTILTTDKLEAIEKSSKQKRIWLFRFFFGYGLVAERERNERPVAYIYFFPAKKSYIIADTQVM